MPQADVMITEVVTMVLYLSESDEVKDITFPSGNERGVWDFWSISLAVW